MSTEVWGEVYDRIADLARAHRTTLVFANTRRLAERAARRPRRTPRRQGGGLPPREPRARAALRGGAASQERHPHPAGRHRVARARDRHRRRGPRMPSSARPATVATLLQRVGRSGHGVEATPKGRLFPLSRDDLVECAALLDAECATASSTPLSLPERPLDVLAPADRGRGRRAGVGDGRAAHPRAARVALPILDSQTFRVGGRDARGRVHHPARAPQAPICTMIGGERAAAGAARGAHGRPHERGNDRGENADYAVVLEPSGTVIGTLNEDFAIRGPCRGDIFQLGLHSWRILRVESDRIRVERGRARASPLPSRSGSARHRAAPAPCPRRVSRLRETVGRLVAGDVGRGRFRFSVRATAARKPRGSRPGSSGPSPGRPGKSGSPRRARASSWTTLRPDRPPSERCRPRRPWSSSASSTNRAGCSSSSTPHSAAG